MKYLILLVTISVSFAIRVPNTWHKDDRRNRQIINTATAIHDKFRTNNLLHGSETPLHPKPHVYPNKRNNRVFNKRRNVAYKRPTGGFGYPKKLLYSSPLSNPQVSNDWVPIIPQNYRKPNNNGNYQQTKSHYTRSFPKKPNVLYKNYRDDKTHEPNVNSYYLQEKPAKAQKEPETESYEELLDIPTKPIYPGEGKWAKPGIKYRTYITKPTEPPLESNEEKPDGYDIFQDAEKVFNKQRNNFAENSEFPQKYSLEKYKEEEESEGEGEGDDSDEEASAGFTPMKLYTQVRRSEDEEHLPAEIGENGKLREVIKDSKVQTVYTEEGYEDSAYDHAGHEKNAENDEGFAEFDKAIEKEKEKKLPKHYPQLVIPQEIHYVDNAEDQELEQYKREKLAFDDVDVEEADPAPAGTEFKPPKKRRRKKKNNFIKTKETKTMAVKDKGDGNMQMEISSEVKVIMQPNNSSKAHKYVKIYPKVYKDMNQEVQKESFEQIYPDPKPNADKVSITTTTTLPQIITEDIPTTITPTSELPKSTEQSPSDLLLQQSAIFRINKAFIKIRRKRFANDFPTIEPDTDFIDKIKHELPEEIPDQTHVKYPYYNSKDINENSPLRYSEDLESIPQKTHGNMAFYEQADGKMDCANVESDIDPIPDRVKNAEENAEAQEETTDVAELAQSPRLGSLGDKIDCFKAKYFGENPLDSPIFKEDIIEPVKPIFKEIEEKLAEFKVENHSKPKEVKVQQEKVVDALTTPDSAESEEVSTVDVLDKENEILLDELPEEQVEESGEEDSGEKKVYSSKITDNKNTEPNEFKNKIQEEMIKSIYSSVTRQQTTTTEVPEDVSTVTDEVLTLPPTEPSVITIITTPNYTIDLQPKHIYDQIDLLEYLPNFNETNAGTNENSELRNNTITKRQPKSLGNSTEVPVDTPESQALIKRRRRIRPKRPMYHVFDVNRLTTPYPLIHQMPSTVLPKYKVVSEVFYKDEIKPNEQLNVFADIINNIKNSSEGPVDSTGDFSEPIAVKLNHFSGKTKRIKVPSKKIRIRNSDSYMNAYNSLEETSSTTSTTSTMRPLLVYRGRNKHKSHKNNDQFYEELLVTLKQKDTVESADESQGYVKKVARKKPTKDPEVAPSENIDYIEEPITDVLGLVPPGQWQYKTIYNPALEKKLPTNLYAVMEESEAELNKFIVPGMKPPPENQKVRVYSDYKLITSNKIRRRAGFPRRGKRSANRPAYEVLSRNRGKQEEVLEKAPVVEEEEDDYVPHRPKNYHYDEKTGKIVYDKVEVKDEEDDEDVEVYEEVTEKPVVKTTKRSIFAGVTRPPPGESYIDFVKKLKEDKNYLSIPDPTTTEKGAEATTVSTTTPKAVSTTPPAFLAILAKVKSDSSYKVIEDKKPTKATTTTEAPEEEEEEEAPLENVQNSPGGLATKIEGLQIFDITDFLPKVKNYLPRTSIDTSKYKTIERPSTRHNLSSRYNSDEEKNLEEVNTSRKPVVLEEDNPQTSESKYESLEELEEATTTSTTTTTTTTTATPPTEKRIRVRGRKRVTTVRNVEPSTTTERVVIDHAKPKRTYIRRRPTRIKIRTTTEKNVEEEESDDTTKIIRRRSETETSVINEEDHTEKFDPIVVDEDDEDQEDDRVARIQTPDEDSKNRTEVGKPGAIEPRTSRKISDVEVFNKFDKTKKHGGNYRRQQGEESKNSKIVRRGNYRPKLVEYKNPDSEIQRLTDVVPKPFAFYTDPKLPKTINQLTETTSSPVEELEGIVSVTDESKGDEAGEEEYDDVHINFDSEEKASTKKPVIVQDPSKRLYYYAAP